MKYFTLALALLAATVTAQQPTPCSAQSTQLCRDINPPRECDSQTPTEVRCGPVTAADASSTVAIVGERCSLDAIASCQSQLGLGCIRQVGDKAFCNGRPGVPPATATASEAPTPATPEAGQSTFVSLGNNTFCRGPNGSNDPANFRTIRAISLQKCRKLCKEDCQGIEFQARKPSQCELHTVIATTAAATPSAFATCFKKVGAPSVNPATNPPQTAPTNRPPTNRPPTKPPTTPPTSAPTLPPANELIRLNFVKPTSQEIRTVFTNAKNFLESFVTGVANQPGFQVTIDVDVAFIDGPGTNGRNVLGQAGPRQIVRSPDGRVFPLAGVMIFDSFDINQLLAGGSLQNVITHEMMHVLGHGTLWELNGLADAGCRNQLSQATSTIGVLFKGTQANAAFVAAGGQGPAPIENTGSAGSRCGHWRESVLRNELGTPSLNFGLNPTSLITVAAFKDIGYATNPNSPSVSQTFRVGAANNILAPGSWRVEDRYVIETEEPMNVTKSTEWWNDRSEDIGLSPLPHEEIEIITLPSYHLSGAQSLCSSVLSFLFAAGLSLLLL